MPDALPVPVIIALSRAIQDGTLVFHDGTIHAIEQKPHFERVYHDATGTMFIPLTWVLVRVMWVTERAVWLAKYPGGVFWDYKP